jgi:hypothetical protein
LKDISRKLDEKLKIIQELWNENADPLDQRCYIFIIAPRIARRPCKEVVPLRDKKKLKFLWAKVIQKERRRSCRRCKVNEDV